MIEVTGKILDLAFDFMTGKPKITLEINEKQAITAGYDELKHCDKVSVKIAKYRKNEALTLIIMLGA